MPPVIVTPAVFAPGAWRIPLRHRLLPSLPVAVLSAALLAPLLGCYGGASAGVDGGVLPTKEKALQGGAGAQFRTGGQVGPGAKKCGPDGCPAEAK